MDKRRPGSWQPRRVIVPLVLAVSVVGTAAALVTTVVSGVGCTDHKPTVDAGRDAPGDSPIV